MSGRDEKSVAALAALLETMDHARVQPEEVRTVRDPVLSDNYYSDVDGSCWRKDTGEPRTRYRGRVTWGIGTTLSF